MARQVLENGVILPAEYSDDWYDDMTSNLTKLDDVIGSDSEKLSSADVGAAALSNNYNDLDNLPTIPTVNDATLTIQKNGVDVQTFTANASSNVTANITVPTKTSDLTNDSNFVDTSNSAVASGITSAKVTDYDAHIADTDKHVTSSDKTTWNTVTSKANDSDVVHKSGNETISGDKVFNNRLIKNIDVVLGTAPSTGKFSNIDIADNNKSSLLQMMCGVYANGQSYARFFVQNKTADDGTGLSPTGTLRGCGFSIILPASSTSEGQGSITPRGNKTTDFGLSSYQWRNLWCEKLYLNGTQLNPSAFVTTDTAQTISGNKTFSSNVNVYNSDSSTDTANIILKNSKAERGVESPEQSINFIDKNNNLLSKISCSIDNNNSTRLYITAYDINNNSDGFFLRRTTSGTSIIPTTSSAVWLGNMTAPFYSVQAKKINTLEPSSLSLPSDRSARIDISSYITNLGNGDNNQYIVPANGYIWLHFTSINSALCYSQTSGGLTNYAQTFVRYQGDGQLYAFFPVRKNDYFIVQIYTASTAVVQNAYFIPCQGNV